MLKGIPKILSPELLKVLCEMGHSDRLVIADGNFPSESMGKDAIVIRCDGHGVPEILDAILEVFPLDTYVENPVNLMQLMPGDVGKVETPIWDTYKEIVAKHDERGADAIGNIESFAFYDEAKTAYAIIATGESAIYANVMLQKGVVVEQKKEYCFKRKCEDNRRKFCKSRAVLRFLVICMSCGQGTQIVRSSEAYW